ncbi:thiamine pyrophosphate-dependent enzyme [Pseudofrankia sp. DC12]|uniref:thiamine pyrophosphate-dependent enzyme n=1 Tax=Pseudofrankia sp. DC12 TaxID=683315 RepID=UPI0005F7C2B3|nr:thiamine pyrophosphate-dependent enzyme [Pseudofrankia sp. DC12]
MGGRRTTGQALVDGLLAHGVDTVFGLPGVQTYALFDALGERSAEITLVGARHEQACAYMALGYAQSSGRPGVCTVVPGPGVLNAAAGLLTAAGTGTPVVCLTSDVPTAYAGRGMGHLHEMPDQLATLRSFVKWAETIRHPAQAPGLLAEAFARAASGRPGPVVLAAPWDVLGAAAEVPAPRVQPPDPPPPVDEAAVRAAADLLAAARNPMIMIGSGARHAGAEVRALAALLGAPVVAQRGDRGVLRDDDPYAFTGAAGFAHWAGTDVLLMLGTRGELTWFRWPVRSPGPRLVSIDIDPRQHVWRDPAVAVTADARDAAAALVGLLRDRSSSGRDARGRPVGDRDGPEATMVELRPSRAAEFAAVKSRFQADVASRLRPHADYLAAIRAALPEDGYFVEEISQVGFASLFAFPVYAPRHFVTAGHQGTLGFGFPTALGVKAAHRDRPVVSVTGDGGFLFGAAELATAVQYGLGVVTVVFDNGAYGNVKADQDRLFGREAGSVLRNPDFVALARAFGADGARAESPGDLGAVLATALSTGRPTVIHVPMPLDPAVTPWTYLTPAVDR